MTEKAVFAPGGSVFRMSKPARGAAFEAVRINWGSK